MQCFHYAAGLGAEIPWTSGWLPIFSELIVEVEEVWTWEGSTIVAHTVVW